MAMRNENDIPELVPFDDRYPSPEDLFRSPEDMSDEQFALLAAAWAEGDLDAENLTEIESIFANDQTKRALAEEFRKIRLTPGKEKWHNRNSLIRTAPPVIRLQRALFVSLASAAVLLAFFTLRPMLRHVSSENSPVTLHAVEITSVKQESLPHAIPGIEKERILKTKNIIASAPVAEIVPAENISFSHASPLELEHNPETVRLISNVNPGELRSMHRNLIQADTPQDATDVNWIMKSITAISHVITKEDKPVDGYLIAGACVKGLNTALGWEMELERVLSDDGDPVKINFSSSLLSFSSLVKKSLQEP